MPSKNQFWSCIIKVIVCYRGRPESYWTLNDTKFFPYLIDSVSICRGVGYDMDKLVNLLK